MKKKLVRKASDLKEGFYHSVRGDLTSPSSTFGIVPWKNNAFWKWISWRRVSQDTSQRANHLGRLSSEPASVLLTSWVASKDHTSSITNSAPCQEDFLPRDAAGVIPRRWTRFSREYFGASWTRCHCRQIREEVVGLPFSERQPRCGNKAGNRPPHIHTET